MTKNSGPKKRARAAAKALNLPLSEAKHQAALRSTRGAHITEPASITLKVHPEHQGIVWDRSRDSHAIIEGKPGSGKTRLIESISTQASNSGETIIHATVTTDEILLTISAQDRDVTILEGPDAYRELERQLEAALEDIDAAAGARSMVILDGYNHLTIPIKAQAADLARKGRSAGVTLVLANPAGESLDDAMRRLLTLRVNTGFETSWENREWDELHPGAVCYRALRDELLPAGRDLTVASSAPVARGRLDPQQVRFNGKRTAWHVRGHAKNGRYTLVTCSQFGDVLYSVIDWVENVRGAIDVIGGGVGIETVSGVDPAVIDALEMLEGSFGVSHRNRVPLVISGRRVAGVWHEMAGPAAA